MNDLSAVNFDKVPEGRKCMGGIPPDMECSEDKSHATDDFHLQTIGIEPQRIGDWEAVALASPQRQFQERVRPEQWNGIKHNTRARNPCTPIRQIHGMFLRADNSS